MKCYGYKGTGPIGCNDNGLIDPIAVIARSNKDSIGLGFKKVPFHLGINKFVPEPECSVENEAQTDSDVPEDSDDGEDPYPYPIPYDLAKFFAEPDDFVPHVHSMERNSDSSSDAANVCNIKYLSKNPEDEGEWVPTTFDKF